MQNATYLIGNGWGPDWGSASGTAELTTIPRHFSSTPTMRVVESTLTSVTIEFTATEVISRTQYSLNGGNTWIDVHSDLNWYSGRYTINNLSPNSSYRIFGDFMRRDSGLWCQTKPYVDVKTKDIARIIEATNFNLGENYTIKYSNQSGAKIAVGIYDTNGAIAYAKYRDTNGSQYTFKFTDEELDKIYKAMKNGKLDVNVYINTQNNTWNDYKKVKINLTGNQKTEHIKVNGQWKRAKEWIKINGQWKRCVNWVKVNGQWKRCV